MSWIIATPTHPVEARRWTVVFHRQAENWFFDLIAMGRFKHVSAFAWLPDLGIWVFYDVRFSRTVLSFQADGVPAHATIHGLVTGNAAVTFDVQARPASWRPVMLCTTAITHLLGLSGHTLRPDALFRLLVAKGGTVRDERAQDAGAGGRPQPAG